ncbi:MAG: ribose 5-phosphate isomerase B [Bifidobacteriaceae bacterium]|jgi:ribose 5-phosphate isomerase B|nr:ribose 5-phosphate isomerase B [Bifidobacteriaceae bacterium]
MKIAVASDHAGLNLKNAMLEVLQAKHWEFTDLGTYTPDSTDYPIWGKLVAEKVASQEYDRGLIVCGSGIGIAIAANRVKGIRAANCSNTTEAHLSREHNDANVLALGGRTLGTEVAADIVRIFFTTDFSQGERHQRRIDELG